MTMAPTDSPEGLRPPGGRPRDEDRRTRKPLAFWDRIKFLLLLTVFWFVLLWSTKSGNPLVSLVRRVPDRGPGGRLGPHPDRPGGPAPDPLPDQRALGSLSLLLDPPGVRRHRADHPPEAVRLDPVPPLAPDHLGVLDRRARGGARPGEAHHPGGRPAQSAQLYLDRAAVRPAANHHPALRGAPVRRDLLVPVPGRRGCLLPGRHQDPVHRRLGPGPRAGAGEGEHPVPGGPGADRVPGRLRARRHPALGTARHRQDADGGGGGGRDRPPVRVRGPGCVHQHVHGRRHPQGQVPVPQAAPARAPVRRRDRVLRRG